MLDTILHNYDTADPPTRAAGMAWYADTQRLVRADARRYRVPVATVAGVYAACSIRQSWAGNVTMARRVLSGEIVGLPAVRARCMRLMAERPHDFDSVYAIMGSNKIRSFFANIMGRSEFVTVDGWAMVGAGMAETFKSARIPRRGLGYDRIAAEYRLAASMRGVAPSVLQAVVWVQVRGRAR